MCRFLVWWPDRGGTEDSAKCFEAIDVEDAAEKFADWHDSWHAEYFIVKGETAHLKVRREDGSFVVNVKVDGETVCSYSGYVEH